jgi:hypothetical protein
VALTPLARRATGFRRTLSLARRAAFRFARLEICALPQVRVKGARLQNGARSRKARPAPSGKRTQTPIVGRRRYGFHNYDIASFDDIYAEVKYSGPTRRRRAVVACEECK